LNKWPPATRQEIKLALIERAHGMCNLLCLRM
jgi:hypothetical protein